MKDSLEIVTEQVRLEGGFKRDKIRTAECLRQTVPNRWASVKQRCFAKCFGVYTRDDKGSGVGSESYSPGWSPIDMCIGCTRLVRYVHSIHPYNPICALDIPVQSDMFTRYTRTV